MKDHYTSASVMAADAAGLGRPATCRPASQPCDCALCGRAIPAGDYCEPFKPTSGFTDCASLAAPASRTVCWQCKALWSKDFLMTYAKSVITPAGFFRFASNAAIASAMLSPPEPPFVLIYSTAQQQHLIWRTPINLSRERFVIRFGIRLITVSHRRLLAGVTAMDTLFAAADAAGIKHATTPWPAADRDLEFAYAPIDPRLIELRDTNREEFAAISQLTPGECWALSIIGYSGLREPVRLSQSLPSTSTQQQRT